MMYITGSEYPYMKQTFKTGTRNHQSRDSQPNEKSPPATHINKTSFDYLYILVWDLHRSKHHVAGW